MRYYLVILLVCFRAFSIEGDGTCRSALDACDEYTKAQQDSIALCKQEVKDLEDHIVEDDASQTRHTILYTVLGIIAGGLAVKAFSK